jgi:hypothetical protein
MSTLLESVQCQVCHISIFLSFPSLMSAATRKSSRTSKPPSQGAREAVPSTQHTVKAVAPAKKGKGPGCPKKVGKVLGDSSAAPAVPIPLPELGLGLEPAAAGAAMPVPVVSANKATEEGPLPVIAANPGSTLITNSTPPASVPRIALQHLEMVAAVAARPLASINEDDKRSNPSPYCPSPELNELSANRFDTPPSYNVPNNYDGISVDCNDNNEEETQQRGKHSQKSL